MLVTVTVKPGSTQETVLESDEGYLIYTRARAEGGKANKRVIELLAEHLSIPKSLISIRSGAAYSKKIIEVDDSVV